MTRIGEVYVPSHLRASQQGLYFLGELSQYSLASSMINGVGRDAKHVANHLAELDLGPQQLDGSTGLHSIAPGESTPGGLSAVGEAAVESGQGWGAHARARVVLVADQWRPVRDRMPRQLLTT